MQTHQSLTDGEAFGRKDSMTSSIGFDRRWSLALKTRSEPAEFFPETQPAGRERTTGPSLGLLSDFLLHCLSRHS